jgi:hypothetical protein
LFCGSFIRKHIVFLLHLFEAERGLKRATTQAPPPTKEVVAVFLWAALFCLIAHTSREGAVSHVKIAKGCISYPFFAAAAASERGGAGII